MKKFIICICLSLGLLISNNLMVFAEYSNNVNLQPKDLVITETGGELTNEAREIIGETILDNGKERTVFSGFENGLSVLCLERNERHERFVATRLCGLPLPNQKLGRLVCCIHFL